MKHFVLIAATISMAVSMPAMAYIDPGSGSAIMSAIIGAFVAITMVVKSYWYKIKSCFPGNAGKAPDPEAETEAE